MNLKNKLPVFAAFLMCAAQNFLNGGRPHNSNKGRRNCRAGNTQRLAGAKRRIRRNVECSSEVGERINLLNLLTYFMFCRGRSLEPSPRHTY